LGYGNSICNWPCIELDQAERDLLKQGYTHNKSNLVHYFFEANNNLLVVRDTFFYNKEVPDAHRYDLIYNRNASTWELQGAGNTPLVITNESTHEAECGRIDKCLNVLAHREALQNPILVFFESPHDDEYDYNNGFNPLRPANGITGLTFYNYFTDKVLPKIQSILGFSLVRERIYSICFVNPVPFQASLHFIHGKEINKSIRDKVWKALYPLCECDFVRRVSSYNPFIILNMCTGGHNKGIVPVKSLKFLVKSTIGTQINCNHKCHVYHPSSWTRSSRTRGVGWSINHPNACIQW
jgi:hypothetical protein